MMTILMQILSHTPRWVWVLLAVLVWVGTKQLQPQRVTLKRASTLPLVMVLLSMMGVLSAFSAQPLALLGWALGAGAVFAAVATRPAPAGTRFDALSQTFQVPGSAVPLTLMLSIFVTKYAVGIAMGMSPHLAENGGFALAVGLLYGSFSGAFAARGWRLLRLARAPQNVVTA
jgi:hypothetical protein